MKLAAAAREEALQERLRAEEEAEARRALGLLLQAQERQRELLGRIVKAAQERAAGDAGDEGGRDGVVGGGVGAEQVRLQLPPQAERGDGGRR